MLAILILMACGSDTNEYYIGGAAPATITPPVQKTYNASTNQNDASVNPAVTRYEFPHLKGGKSVVVVHNAKLNDMTGETGVNYSVEWDTEKHALRWCCYQMNASLLQKNTSRYDGDRSQRLTPESAYPNDPDIDEKYRFTADPYWNSGFDHGHICPSNDRLSSEEANYQTFFMTNMSPQVNSFNSGIWVTMELKIHDKWARQFQTLYVCKGGTIDNSDHIIKYIGSGQNKIPVPKYYFTALLGATYDGQYTAIGLYIQHDGTINKNASLSNYAMNIRSLEKLTGIDFFCNLPGTVEDDVENRDINTLKGVWGL